MFKASWFPTLILCSPNLPRVYIRLCKHGNHFTFLQYYMNITVKPDILLLYHYFTISVHCSTVEVQSVFLLISSSSLVYFTDCNCSMTGANETSCHPETGQCSCRENVIGQHCEQCEINYYNFNSGAGCSSCDCNPTYSTSLQCDGNTGVCSCKPGINGAKCTGCADQFYNLTDQGNVYNT